MNYVIVTNAGYWGQGKSLNEAAKNAKVRAGKTVRGMIIRTDEQFHDKVTVDDMGVVMYTLTEEAAALPRHFRSAMRNTANLGYFHLKMYKGNLCMTVAE